MVTIHCMKEAVWLKQLLAGVRYVQEEPTSIMCDNQGCIALGKIPTHPLVENIAKKNRSHFPIAVLLTTLICSH